MSMRNRTSRQRADRSSGFGLVFVPNQNADPRKLTRGLIAQALHQAAQEAAAQAETTDRAANGGENVGG